MSNDTQWKWLDDPAYNQINKQVLKQTIESLVEEYRALEGEQAYENFHERFHERLKEKCGLDMDQNPEAYELLSQHIWHMEGVYRDMMELIVGMFVNANDGDPYCYETTYELMMESLQQEYQDE